jgi:hypothetical protein
MNVTAFNYFEESKFQRNSNPRKMRLFKFLHNELNIQNHEYKNGVMEEHYKN